MIFKNVFIKFYLTFLDFFWILHAESWSHLFLHLLAHETSPKTNKIQKKNLKPNQTKSAPPQKTKNLIMEAVMWLF